MGVRASFAALALALLATSCLMSRRLEMPSLATARVVSDYPTYEMRRVGLLPFAGAELDPQQSHRLQLAFLTEIGQSTPYEVVPLEAADLEEVEESDPLRRGGYRPKTIIQLAKRYRLDGMLFGTVTQQRPFPPQLLTLSLDLVSAETGLVVWSSSVHLDAGDPRVRDGLKLFYADEEQEDAWRVALLSPERFARFAAFQVACLL